MFAALALALGVVLPGSAPAKAAAADEGFSPIFDGRSLSGWHSPDLSWWSVEDGAITGRIPPGRPCATNQYLVWQGGDLADFELKLQSRLSGEGAINNGFQFRSRVLPDGDVAGYQMDNNLQTDWQVRLYDEFGRHTLAWRGQRTVFDLDGRRTSSPLEEGSGPAWFRLEDWHEYHLTCIGPRLTLRVNGRLAAEVEDHDRRRADPQGALALQLHSGPPTLVQFRDIRLKTLRPAVTAPAPTAEPARTALLASALAGWDLGVGGHTMRRPLRYVGSLDDVEFNVRAEGPGAQPAARVTLLRGGHFEADRDVRPAGTGITVFVRARDPEGRWQGDLLTQGRGPGHPGLALAAQAGTLTLTVRGRDTAASVTQAMPSRAADGWHDIVGRVDGRALGLFLDGRQVARRDWEDGLLPPVDLPLLVGAGRENGTPARFFHGELEEVAVWSRALSDEEIAQLSRRPTSR